MNMLSTNNAPAPTNILLMRPPPNYNTISNLHNGNNPNNQYAHENDHRGRAPRGHRHHRDDHDHLQSCNDHGANHLISDSHGFVAMSPRDIQPMCLPPGYRFHPTDAELIVYYLSNKVANPSSFNVPAIAEVDLNKCEPWDLPGTLLPLPIYIFVYVYKYPTNGLTNLVNSD